MKSKAVNVEKEKLEIIKWVTGLKDNTAIERLKMLRQKSGKADWWTEITDEDGLQLTRVWMMLKQDA